jgi:small subunit ribosomal protein S4
LSRRLVPKYKIDRRLGVNLWGRPKSPFNVRTTKPGQHGRGGMRKKRISNYGIQLAEKQKLQFYYGMKEKQFRTFFAKSSKSKDNVAKILIAMLEARLDAFVYRMKWAPTIFAAKQMIKHKHILVNGKVTSVCSYILTVDDMVSLRETIKDHVKVKESMELAEREIPTYFEVSDNNQTGKFIKLPVLDEVPYPIKINPYLIVEYYSRKL